MNELAFPGTEDHRTVEDVDRHIKEANAQGVELPPLPEPSMRMSNFDGEKLIHRQRFYSEEKMDDHARATAAPLLERIAELEAVCERAQKSLRYCGVDDPHLNAALSDLRRVGGGG